MVTKVQYIPRLHFCKLPLLFWKPRSRLLNIFFIDNNICIYTQIQGDRLEERVRRSIDWWVLDVVECALAVQEGDEVARSCEVCGKAPTYGRQISHAHNVSSRLWYPNVQRLKVIVGKTRRRMRVCTRCLRSGRVVKAAHRVPRATA